LHHAFQQLFLAAELLGAFRVCPDIGRFESEVDLDQAGSFDIEVKDTPEVRSPAGEDR
jgi:hypothetical protein